MAFACVVSLSRSRAKFAWQHGTASATFCTSRQTHKQINPHNASILLIISQVLYICYHQEIFYREVGPLWQRLFKSSVFVCVQGSYCTVAAK